MHGDSGQTLGSGDFYTDSLFCMRAPYKSNVCVQSFGPRAFPFPNLSVVLAFKFASSYPLTIHCPPLNFGRLSFAGISDL